MAGVNWYQANDFARGLGGRLPTEAEWEKACRRTDGRIYPWGNDEPDKTRANLALTIFVAGMAPVGCFPAGASPYGALDMSGNANEWTASQRIPYPCSTRDGRNDPNDYGTWQVARGGSFQDVSLDVRCAMRFGHSSWASNFAQGWGGLRIVLDPD